MLIRRFTISCTIAVILLLTLSIPVLANINTGIEWQYQDDQLSTSAIRLNWLVSDRWTARGSYQWKNRDLSAGLTYKQSKGPWVSSFVGLGFRDLLNEAAPEDDFEEKTELITGVQINLNKAANGPFIMIEARIVGSTIANDSHSKALDPIISISLNFRAPGRRTPRVKVPESISEADFDLLVRLVAAEAGGEPYDGQVAVAAVVLNRMNSYKFPNTIRGVVYQENQFSSVPKLPYIQPGESCRRAVVEALNGIDPSNGALYFYNPETSSERGLRFFESANLRVTARIGNHVFLTE
jgi:hypothetical protein